MRFDTTQRSVAFLGILVVAALAVLGFTSVLANPVKLTQPDGLSATPVATGSLPEPVRAVFSNDLLDGTDTEEQDSETPHFSTEIDVSTVTITKYEVEPGGTFGWHQHGGPVWVVVTEGALTIYNETCEQDVYPAGSALVDYGNHTHMGINEETEPLELYVVFMLPLDGAPRVDVEQPEDCDV